MLMNFYEIRYHPCGENRKQGHNWRSFALLTTNAFQRVSQSCVWPWARAVRRRNGGRHWRWVVLWPTAAARRAFFIGGGGGVALWSAATASDRMREHWNGALGGRTFFSGCTCHLRWAAGADKLTVNMHALRSISVLMSCSLLDFWRLI